MKLSSRQVFYVKRTKEILSNRVKGRSDTDSTFVAYLCLAFGQQTKEAVLFYIWSLHRRLSLPEISLAVSETAKSSTWWSPNAYLWQSSIFSSETLFDKLNIQPFPFAPSSPSFVSVVSSFNCNSISRVLEHLRRRRAELLLIVGKFL